MSAFSANCASISASDAQLVCIRSAGKGTRGKLNWPLQCHSFSTKLLATPSPQILLHSYDKPSMLSRLKKKAAITGRAELHGEALVKGTGEGKKRLGNPNYR